MVLSENFKALFPYVFFAILSYKPFLFGKPKVYGVTRFNKNNVTYEIYTIWSSLTSINHKHHHNISKKHPHPKPPPPITLPAPSGADQEHFYPVALIKFWEGGGVAPIYSSKTHKSERGEGHRCPLIIGAFPP